MLARLTDRTPLILEKKIGEGRVLVFTSTFDNIANDLPLHASFVPFVEQSASYLSGIDQTAADFAVDSYVDLHSAKDQGAAVEVLDPDGKRPLSLHEAASAQTLKLSARGLLGTAARQRAARIDRRPCGPPRIGSDPCSQRDPRTLGESRTGAAKNQRAEWRRGAEAARESLVVFCAGIINRFARRIFVWQPLSGG